MALGVGTVKSVNQTTVGGNTFTAVVQPTDGSPAVSFVFDWTQSGNVLWATLLTSACCSGRKVDYNWGGNSAPLALGIRGA